VQKVYGFVFASVLLFAGGAQAFQLNMHTPTMHTPTIHQLNPQPLPPGAAISSGGGTGKVIKSAAMHNGAHIPK
jgi:hypothetical protein